jgi:hypothetical protein
LKSTGCESGSELFEETMPDEFNYDVFLNHSSKDKALVRPLAERLRSDGLKVWFDEWEPAVAASRQSAANFSGDQANRGQKDGGALPSRRTCGRGNLAFRDPLNKERRFLPVRLDDAPIKGSLAQFRCFNTIRAPIYCSRWN